MTVASTAINCHVQWACDFDPDEATKSALEKSLDDRVQKVRGTCLIDGALILESTDDNLSLAKDCRREQSVMTLASIWHICLWVLAFFTMRWAFGLETLRVRLALGISGFIGAKDLQTRVCSAMKWKEKRLKYEEYNVPLAVAQMRKEGYENGLSYIMSQKTHLERLYCPKELRTLVRKEVLGWQSRFHRAKTPEEKGLLTQEFLEKSCLLSDALLPLLVKAFGAGSLAGQKLGRFQEDIKRHLQGQITLQILTGPSLYNERVKVQVWRNKEAFLTPHMLMQMRKNKAYWGFFDETFSRLEELALSFNAV